MHYINPSSVVSWKLQDNIYIPSSVDTVCPFCCQNTALELTFCRYDNALNFVTFKGRCIRCSELSKVFINEPRLKQGQTDKKCQEIWLIPVPKGIRQERKWPSTLPKRIKIAYENAIKCFNTGIWTSTVTECGRVLEGITADQFSTEEDRKELKYLSNTIHQNNSVQACLFKPILQLTKAIRLGRYTGAHFNMEKEADQQVAEQVLELTEYILEYFYNIPEKSTALEEAIEVLESPEKLS